MTPRLIAFAGLARAGKDTLAAALVARGWEIYNFGHVIKAYFAPYIAAEESAGDLLRRLQQTNPALSLAQLDAFFADVLMPFELHDFAGDAFTEIDAEKRVLRPILEHGGELIYDYVMAEYFRVIDAKWSAGKSVVNTRLVRVPEAEQWTRRGGIIIEVSRAGQEAASPWEADYLEILRASEHVAYLIPNDGTLAEWETLAQVWAQQVAEGEEVAV